MKILKLKLCQIFSYRHFVYQKLITNSALVGAEAINNVVYSEMNELCMNTCLFYIFIKFLNILVFTNGVQYNPS